MRKIDPTRIVSGRIVSGRIVSRKIVSRKLSLIAKNITRGHTLERIFSLVRCIVCFLCKYHFGYFCGSAVMVIERTLKGVGALAGAQLRIVSETQSETLKIQADRDWSATADFAGALMLSGK